MARRTRNTGERGTMILVVVFIAMAIAALAAISSGRVVSGIKMQSTLESETRAYNNAYAQIHMAMNVVNTSAYNENNQNVALRGAIDGDFGGTVAGAVQDAVNVDPFAPKGLAKKARETASQVAEKTAKETREVATTWLDDPEGVVHGLVEGTSVRVYRGRDYIKRLQKLRGLDLTDVDPFGDSDQYFVLEAAGRSVDTVRLVAALVRENEPFSSFVFFQNRATLGVSGAPRGLIHGNEDIAFYFPKGNYVDPVSAVDGFSFLAGATRENTSLRDANNSATKIDLSDVDFADLKAKADLFVGDAGMDAQIKFQSNGKVRIKEYTPPRFDEVEKSRTFQRYTGYRWETEIQRKNVQVGTKKVAYQDQVVDYYKTENYWVWQNVKVGTKNEKRTRNKKVQTGTKTVTKTRQDPIYSERTVTKTRRVKVWQSYGSGDAGGGTSVGGGGAGDLGEWVWIDEPYETTETYISGYKTVSYKETVPVYETVVEEYWVKVNVYEKQKVQKTRQVPVYKTVTKYRNEPVYELQDVPVKKKVKEYETVTETWTETVFQNTVHTDTKFVKADGSAGDTIFIDGRITKMDGKVNGRVTIVGNEKVRITGNIRYVDKQNRTAMKNGDDFNAPYQRNPEYQGDSVLGVIARDDILMTRTMPSNAEVNGTLMAVNGRVGVDGFWAKPDGELVQDSNWARGKYLSEEQQLKESAYDKAGWSKTKRFTKNSLRRIGGIISNNRILETYIKARSDGTSYVASGFKRGNMQFDVNVLFNPPPNFVEVPRPVVTSFMPIVMVRNGDA